jgi:hypothetical protein
MNNFEGSYEEVEKNDATGPSRMVHAMWQQRQLRLVKVFRSTYSELYSGIYYCKWILC